MDKPIFLSRLYALKQQKREQEKKQEQENKTQTKIIFRKSHKNDAVTLTTDIFTYPDSTFKVFPIGDVAVSWNTTFIPKICGALERSLHRDHTHLVAALYKNDEKYDKNTNPFSVSPFITGKQIKNENIYDAAQRECYEETGSHFTFTELASVITRTYWKFYLAEVTTASQSYTKPSTESSQLLDYQKQKIGIVITGTKEDILKFIETNIKNAFPDTKKELNYQALCAMPISSFF